MPAIYLMKISKYTLLVILFVFIAIIVVLFVPPFWRNLVVYPRLDKEVAALNQLRKQPAASTGLTTYRGIMHAHSYWSHDSEGTIHDLVFAARKNSIEFIFLTDHPRGNMDTFPRGYHGNYDGVLIEPGSERQKLAIWPLSKNVTDWSTDKDTLVKNIVQAGGMAFYVHTEEPHNWGNPFYQGMEIYNFHTDTKDERLLPHIANFLINGKSYRHWALREMFDDQKTILALWDSLNVNRKIVGFSAVDTHENQNIRARKLVDGRIQWVGPNAKPFDTVSVNFRNRWLFQEPDANGWVFKLMIDTYNEGFNYITNYVLADTLSVPSLAQHILLGHHYSAFKSLGDANGFLYWAENAGHSTSGILGDSIPLSQAESLHAISPLPGRFRLVYNGKDVDNPSEESYEYAWKGPLQKGAYRLELHVRLKNKFVPWIYTNPVYIY